MGGHNRWLGVILLHHIRRIKEAKSDAGGANFHLRGKEDNYTEGLKG